MSKPYIENSTFQNRTFAGNDLEPGEYDNCTFSGCTFTEADLSGIIFQECTFSDCDLSMATLKGTAFRDVKFKNSKLLGLRFDDCNPFALSFEFDGCVLHFASFFGLKIPGTHFKNCKLEDVEFTGADLSKANFSDSDLARAIFDQTNLEGADLRKAFHFSIDPERNRIQKAAFSMHNIAGLLHKYRIVIE